MPRRRTLSVLALAILALALVPVVALAWHGGGDRALRIGFDLHLASPTAPPTGTFVASGAVDDSGTTDVAGLAVDPIPGTDRGRLSGTQTFTGAQGTIRTRFEGIARDIDEPHAAGEGRFRIVSGTGAYAGLRGSGRFFIVVDYTTLHFIGTEEGRLR
jgi:hypothetical protein